MCYLTTVRNQLVQNFCSCFIFCVLHMRKISAPRYLIPAPLKRDIMNVHGKNYSDNKILIQSFQFWLCSEGRVNRVSKGLVN